VHKSLWSLKNEFNSHIYNMTLWIISCSLISLFLSILLRPNPLIMGFSILLVALTVGILYGLTISSWLAFLVFLIYVRGILVIFSYFIRLTPNQDLSSNFLLPYLSSLTLITLLTYSTTDIWTPSLSNQTNLVEYLFIHPNSIILILLTVFLFITIVVIVKTSLHSKGPLRSFISYV
jgi:NADH-ubiquinone oxidoreductase chain 6